ncbi:YwqH-like family protein [Peribacillus sp. B-H-3]|uniref:YwqH-like family protein n=1 Tax=Peribacillus sp. B-H-3 TaxID=3400420 RepID=UPI003B01670C
MEQNEARLNSLNSAISQLDGVVREYEEKVRRLSTAKSQISSEQEEFQSNRNLIKEPQLSSDAWAGKHAESFEEIRNDMDSEFSLLSGEDTQAILKDIETKITYYESLISSAASRISGLRSGFYELNN